MNFYLYFGMHFMVNICETIGTTNEDGVNEC
jgi:hypothetical protein